MGITKNDGTIIAVGCVFAETEHYYHDGMDEYTAHYYDAENDKIEYMQVGYYGSDGYNLCGCDWSIDLTAENARKMLHGVLKRSACAAFQRSVIDYKSSVHKGDFVKVVRGRKVPKGYTGYIFWMGEKYNEYSRCNEMIAGLKQNINDKSEKPIFIKAEYLENVNTIKSPSAKERKKFIKAYLIKNYSDIIKIASNGIERYNRYGFRVYD